MWERGASCEGLEETQLVDGNLTVGGGLTRFVTIISQSYNLTISQSHSGKRSGQKRYMRMGNGKYGGVTTDEETEEQADDFEEDYEESNKKRRSRRNSRRSYAEEDDDVDDDDGRLEVHQSREELDQEDKPAMQVIGKNLKKSFLESETC